MIGFESWTQQHLAIVFYFYGLAFLTMGMAIWLQPKQECLHEISEIIWLLGGFGVAHGINEWMDLYALTSGSSPVFDKIRWAMLTISYCFLFEFGRRLIRLNMEWHPPWLQRLAKLLVPWHVPAIALFILIIAIDADDFWGTNVILTRYFLGFPGALLCGLGFLVCFRRDADLLRKLRIRTFPVAAALAFFAYAVFAGLVVPKGSFFPSTWLNASAFLALVGLPVELFRAASAIAIAVLVCRMLRIFRWERH
jgi:hypothetical protein